MTSFVAQPSIAWDDVEQALVEWVRDVVGLEVAWAEEDAPQPERPYVLLDWLAPPSGVGDDYWSQEEDATTKEVDLVREGVRRSVLTVKVLASSTRANESAMYYADLLSGSLDSDTIVDAFFTPNRMAPWSWSELAKGDFAEDSHAISRAGFDLTLGFAAGTGKPSIRMPYITGASVTGYMSAPALTATASITS